jgi:predicted O-methyltransferase YrrM
MMIVPEEIEKYIEQHTSEESEVLLKINRHTHLRVLKPNMLSGHVQGRALAMLSKLIHPKYILEIGTYTGYSAICLAEGIQSGGKLITIDRNEELRENNVKFFEQAGVSDVIEPLFGNALTLIPQLNYTFDIVFIDADKVNYLNYYEMVIDKVQSGGLIIADNVLWKGKLIDPAQNDKDTKAIAEFNKHIQNDNRVENVLLSIRDGLFLIRKL